MKTRRILLVAMALFASLRAPGADAGADPVAASRENLRQLSGALKAYALLYDGKKPDKLSALLDEGLVDGAVVFVVPGLNHAVPARAEVDARTDYTLDALAGREDVLVREKSATHTPGKVLGALNDGSIQLLDAPSDAAAAGPGPRVTESPSANPSTPPSTNVASHTSPTIATSSVPAVRSDSVESAAGSNERSDDFKTANAGAPGGVSVSVGQLELNDVPAQIGAAQQCNARGEIDAAIATYRAIQRVAPQTPNLRTWLAELLIAKHELAEARRLLDEELKAQPNSAWALSWLGTVEMELGHEQSAGATLRRAAALDPNVVRFRYDNGNWLDRNNQPRRALMDYQAVLAMDPRFGGAYYGLGLSFAKLGRPDLAISSYERFLQFDSSSEWAAYARQEIARLRSQK